MNRKNGFVQIFIPLALLLVVGILVAVFFYKSGKIITVSNILNPQKQIGEIVNNDFSFLNFKSNNGYSLRFPKDWFVHVNKNSNDKLSVDISDWNKWDIRKDTKVSVPPMFIQAKIETYDIDGTNSISDFLHKNVLSQYSDIKKEENINLGGLTYLKIKGVEKFTESPFEFMLLGVKYNDKYLVIKANSPSIIHYEQVVEEMVKSIKPSTTGLVGSVVKVLGASDAQDPIPPSLTGIEFSPLQVMGDKKDDSIGNSEQKYNNLLSKGYVFQALSGQRLTTVVDELSQGSFIRSYLFDQDGNLLVGPQDTRIEFTTQYSGQYYLVVSNKLEETKSYKVWVEDRNQTDIVVKLRDFHSGAEVFYPHEEGLRYAPFDKFSIVVDYNGVANPTNSVPVIYSLSGSIDDFNSKAFFPEESPNNIVHTTSYLVDPETVAVYPVNDMGHIVSFPDNSQLATAIKLTPTAGYIDRVFTNFSLVDLSYVPSYPGLVPLTGEQKTLVILYNYQNDPNNKPATADEVNQLIMSEDSGKYSVNDYYKRNSNGKTWLSTTIVGWYTLPYDDGPGCVNYDTQAKKYAQDQGVDVSSYDRLILISANKNCSGGGATNLGETKPTEIHINNSPSFYILTHELGHDFTLGHAHRLYCGDKSIKPYIECTQLNYGDYYNIMGAGNFVGNLRGFQLLSLGWLSKSKVEEVKADGHFTLNTLNSNSDGIELYRIKKADTNEYYYFEYRQPVKYDDQWPANLTQGINVYVGYYIPYRIGVNTFLSPELYIIDTTPETTYFPPNFSDYPLSDGKSFVDDINGIKVTQTSHSNTGATFDVQFTK